MIVTVTLNPAVDKTLSVPAFKPGATNRATIDRVAIGGKGINVARTLKTLGCDVTAAGFLGADHYDGTRAMLAQHGIEADFVPVAGETRVNLKVIDPLTGIETEINEPGFAVAADAIVLLAAKLRALARKASVMVFAGSLPPGAPVDLYAQLVALAQAEGARAMLDTAGAALSHGLVARPDLVKPNRAEAEALLETSLVDDDSLLAAAERMRVLGARSVVISLGPDGALGASREGVWRAHSPAITARSTVGAGDAMMAALAYGLTQSLPPPEALRLATAVSCAVAAAVERDPLSHEIQRLMPRILVEPCPVAPVSAPRGTC